MSDVRKRFRKFTVRGGYTTLKTSLLNRIFGGDAPTANYVDVLHGIDLEVPQGTTLGIIGPNGSGKSTLLKIMAGIIRADSGEVEVRGRVSPLIELGAGFHPEFSGRENVYLNGLVIGMSRAETEDRYDAIVQFAGLADVMDDPVRTYSSGMYMRLAFSVAVHADPDLLLIDEILAVGDEAFSTKCHERLAAFQSAGKSIVMVSHNLASIERWCHEAIWIEKGTIVARGYPAKVASRYHAAAGSEVAASGPVSSVRDSLQPGTLRAEMRVLEPLHPTPEPAPRMVRTMIAVKNVGDTVWRALTPTRRGTVMVGAHLYAAGRLVTETQRAFLPRDIYPGETACVEFIFQLPKPDRYRVVIDLVDEEVCWFADHGSEPIQLDFSL